MLKNPATNARGAMGHEPADACVRRSALPVVCYDVQSLQAGEHAGPDKDLEPALLQRWRESLHEVFRITIPPREAATFRVPAGHGFRIVSVDGPQVGDLNLWHEADLRERFYSGKTRQLEASHLSVGARLWSCLPYLRPMARITADTLAWYGCDHDGARVHDVIGTRCDPYTAHRLKAEHYHHCCHSNLARALAADLGVSPREAEHHVHDVLNVFMCTGFTRDTGQYFMKASPVRPGDSLEFMAEIDLLGALSACPGGDCGSTHSNDVTTCYPLEVQILAPDEAVTASLVAARGLSEISGYDRTHGNTSLETLLHR